MIIMRMMKMRMKRMTKTRDKYLYNEGQRTKRRDEYKGNKDEDEDNKDEDDL